MQTSCGHAFNEGHDKIIHLENLMLRVHQQLCLSIHFCSAEYIPRANINLNVTFLENKKTLIMLGSHFKVVYVSSWLLVFLPYL